MEKINVKTAEIVKLLDELRSVDSDESFIFSTHERTPEENIIDHKEIRDIIAKKKNFLGVGNNGFIVSTNDAVYGEICRKMVWDKLDIFVTDKGLKNLPPDLRALHEIYSHFRHAKTANKNIVSVGNMVQLPANKPSKEFVLQEVSRRILLQENIPCVIPEVFSLTHFSKVEETPNDGRSKDEMYYISEQYTSILMDQVRGLSIQDMILQYPQSKEFLDINVDLFIEQLLAAVRALHRYGIRHQDITARNIMFDLDSKQPVIIDFGKSGCGGWDTPVSEDEEVSLVENEIRNHLLSFIRDPQSKHDNFIAGIKKRNSLAGFDFND